MTYEISQQTVITAINSLICLGIMWSSICRLAIFNHTVVKAARAHASMAFASAMVSLMSPAFGYQVTWGQLMLGATIFISMMFTSQRIRDGLNGDLIIVHEKR